MKRRIILAIILVPLLIVGLLWYSGSPVEVPPDSRSASVVKRVMQVHRGDIRVRVSATGVVTPINVIEIKSKASGIVETIPVEASDRVRIGQLIAKLDQTDTRNQFEQALADSQVASAVLIQQENNWRRAQDLFAKNLLSQEEFDQIRVEHVRAKSQLIKAQSNLVLARQKLAETIVLSPLDGLVLSRNVSAGQIVSSAVSNVGGGTTIARIANMDEVYVVAAVDEVDIGKVRIGQETAIVADAYPSETFRGKVIRMAAQSTVVQNVTTFDVVILVPNRDNKLKAGMNTSITIDVERKDDVILISTELLRDRTELQNDRQVLTDAGVELPDFRRKADSSEVVLTGDHAEFSRRKIRQESNQTEGVLRYVVVQEDDRLILQTVRIGLSNFDDAEVLSGLSDTSTVVLVKFSQVKRDAERFREMLKSRQSFGR
jgi:HlyD family secretion protein